MMGAKQVMAGANRSTGGLAAALATALAIVLTVAAVPQAAAQAVKGPDMRSVERGRYLVRIAGCNDCHTAGYVQSGGKVPEREWLMGDVVGWRGPWGTTYASNLRLVMAKMTEVQWVASAKSAQYRPPMPWFALHAMRTQDLKDIYRFVRYLGPAGEHAPAFVPPGQEPKGPVVQFPAPPKP